MRDLIDLLDKILIESQVDEDTLSEAKLAAAEMPAKKMSAFTNPTTGKVLSRQELFLWKVINSSPFELTSNRGQVIINPKEAANVKAWLLQGMLKPITLTTVDGDTIKNTDLQKTTEFGSKEAEQIKLKGSDVFDTSDTDISDFGNSIESLLSAGGFPAIDTYDKIANSPQIKKLGKIGDAIIYMAKQITQGQTPIFPDNLSAQEIKAIELYASEYLGVLALISGIVPFKQGNRKDFDDFIGADLGSMIMYFPKSVSNPLADSFSVTNDETGHSIKISSKAAGKGAPPSLKSLKLPNDVRSKYPEAAEFLDSAQAPGVSTFAQPFSMMNAMYQVNPDAVPKEYAPLLPFSDDLISTLEATVKSNKPVPKQIMNVFNKRLTDRVKASDNSDGGKAWYAVTTDIIRAVNKGSAVPNLREALIESLGYNFVQLYTNVKGNRLETYAFWPAMIKGQVKLKTKGSAADPKKGKLSVEISPGGGSDEIEIGSSSGTAGSEVDNVDSDDLDAVTQKRSDVKAAQPSGMTNAPGGARELAGDKQSLGRERRRR
jgi:hypothetical protein